MPGIPLGLLLLLLLAVAPRTLPAQPPAGRAETELVLTRVQVVDVEGGRILPERTVRIGGRRILAVEPAGDTATPVGARVVDARGRYLIPGLWDMHAHVLSGFEGRAPLLLAHGITGVRDPGGWLDTLRAVRARLPGVERPLPRLVAAGPLVDGPIPAFPFSVAVADARRAQRMVDSLQAAGADFLKVYQRLPRDAYFALARRARRRGIPFAGHVPTAVRVTEASKAGQRSIEHIWLVALACSGRERQLQRILLAGAADPAETSRAFAAHSEALVATYDAARCAALASHLARNRTWLTPTLHLGRQFSRVGDPGLERDDRFRYLPPGTAERWSQARRPALFFSGTPEAGRRAYALLRDMVRVMRDAGVEILAGTDAPAPYMFPGSALHDELATLVEDGGLSPLEALRAATLHPARYLGATDSLGTVAPGKAADLVLLDADPLVDIGAVRRIAAVVVAGRYLDREALDAMLAEAERRARPPPR